jgi:hypothetical protein
VSEQNEGNTVSNQEGDEDDNTEEDEYMEEDEKEDTDLRQGGFHEMVESSDSVVRRKSDESDEARRGCY